MPCENHTCLMNHICFMEMTYDVRLGENHTCGVYVSLLENYCLIVLLL